MEVTASMVKDLREATGAGMMDCKKALAETNGITYITLIIISNRHKTFNIRTAFMLKKDFEAKKRNLISKLC